jgi:hypothetical protein
VTFRPLFVLKSLSEGIRNFSTVYYKKTGCFADFVLKLIRILEQSAFSVIWRICRLVIQQTDCLYAEAVPKEF